MRGARGPGVFPSCFPVPPAVRFARAERSGEAPSPPLPRPASQVIMPLLDHTQLGVERPTKRYSASGFHAIQVVRIFILRHRSLASQLLTCLRLSLQVLVLAKMRLRFIFRKGRPPAASTLFFSVSSEYLKVIRLPRHVAHCV